MRTSDLTPEQDALVMVIREQFELIKELMAENAAITELLLKANNILPTTEVNVLPEQTQSLGKKPWYLLKKDLERSSRKPRLSELAGIPDEEAL